MDNAFAKKKQMVLADGFTGGNMPVGSGRIHFFLFPANHFEVQLKRF